MTQDEEAFFKDYALSHKKLSELGFTPASLGSMLVAKLKSGFALAAVAVSVAILIWSFFFEVHQEVK